MSLRFLIPLVLALFAGAGAIAQEAPVAPPCGTQPITIARMQWPAAALLAEIHARILTRELGCTMRVIPGDLATTASSMANTGQPAVAPEMWITRIAEIWNAALGAEKLRSAAPSYEGEGFEGWFIPDYVAEALPELASAAMLAANAEAFATPGRRPRLISCPPDWACAVINRNLWRAHGLEAAFELVEPANRFELDTLVAEAVSRREPILFYYWQPNATLAQFNFKALDMGPYDEDAMDCLAQRACPSPQASAFAPEAVTAVLSEWVYDEAPRLAGYFARAQMPLSEMNALLLNLSEPSATIESVADQFVSARGEVWRPWLGQAN